MAKISAKDKARFAAYIEDAKKSPENLAFLLDNLGEYIALDYSVKSLAASESIFWRCIEAGKSDYLVTPEQFAQLLGQYLGECIIHHTGAKWVQSNEQNPMFAQPCIDHFGGAVWERVYPVHAAIHLSRLPQEKPSFPGVRDRRVLATQLERALTIHSRRQPTE